MTPPATTAGDLVVDTVGFNGNVRTPPEAEIRSWTAESQARLAHTTTLPHPCCDAHCHSSAAPPFFFMWTNGQSLQW
jgi:hypothetical protein